MLCLRNSNWCKLLVTHIFAVIITVSCVKDPAVFGFQQYHESCSEQSNPNSSFSESWNSTVPLIVVYPEYNYGTSLNLTTNTTIEVTHSTVNVENETCDTSKDLTCIKGSCQPNCHLKRSLYIPKTVPRTMYDMVKQRCVAKLLEDMDYMYSYRRYSVYCSDDSECPTNAECMILHTEYGSAHGVCVCKDNFTTDSTNNMCLESKGYGENCSMGAQCRNPSSSYPYIPNTICLDSKCRCPYSSTNQIYYNPKLKRCYTNPGQICKLSEVGLYCGGGSTCERASSYPSLYKCKCGLYDFISSDNETCVSGYGRVCGVTKKCNSKMGLQCINGVCTCSSGKHQKYISYDGRVDGGRCVSKIGSKCSNQTISDCIDSSTCINGICRCSAGTSPAANNTICSANYREPCNVHIDYELECNSEQGLSCINQKCLCGKLNASSIQFYSYDQNSSFCNFSNPLPLIETDGDLKCNQNMSDVSLKQIDAASSSDILSWMQVIIISSVCLMLLLGIIYRNKILKCCKSSTLETASNNARNTEDDIL